MLDGETTSTARVGTPSMPRLLMTDSRAVSTKHDIGLNDGDVLEDAVHRGDEHPPEPPGPDVTPDEHEQVPEDVLVVGSGRRRHGQLLLVQRVATAVVRERRVILVGQPHAGHEGCPGQIALGSRIKSGNGGSETVVVPDSAPASRYWPCVS